MPLSSSVSNVLWITVRVGSTATSGFHNATLTIQVGSGVYNVPLNLYVFDFAIPVKPNVRFHPSIQPTNQPLPVVSNSHES